VVRDRVGWGSKRDVGVLYGGQHLRVQHEAIILIGVDVPTTRSGEGWSDVLEDVLVAVNLLRRVVVLDDADDEVGGVRRLHVHAVGG